MTTISRTRSLVYCAIVTVLVTCEFGEPDPTAGTADAAGHTQAGAHHAGGRVEGRDQGRPGPQPGAPALRPGAPQEPGPEPGQSGGSRRPVAAGRATVPGG